MALKQWQRDLRPGSFRGATFSIASSDRGGGRGGPQHEYAQRDIPYAEDTGRKARSFQIEAFVIGPDYMRERDALITALEEVETPGELIHPYYGRQLVRCSDFSVKESAKDGGMAVFTITFQEAGRVAFPSVSADPLSRLSISGLSAIDRAKSDFAAKFSVARMPGFVLESATQKINSLADMLDSSAGGISSITNQINDLAFATRGLRANALDLIQRPSQMADALASSIGLLRQSGSSLRDVYRALAGLYGFGANDATIEATTPNRVRERDNAAAVNELVRTVAIVEAAGAAAEIDFTNIEEAASFRDDLTENIDERMESVSSDEMFDRLQDLRTNVVQAVTPPDRDLARLGVFTPRATIASLLIAYELYDRVDLEPDIVARNRVKHPGFVPGGSPLEVLQLE